eukprot:g22450.t1
MQSLSSNQKKAVLLVAAAAGVATAYGYYRYRQAQEDEDDYVMVKKPAAHESVENKAPAKKATDWLFKPEHFRYLPIKPAHLDLHFDMSETRVIVTLHTTFIVQDKAVTEIALDAQDLEVKSVELVQKFTPLPEFKAEGDTKSFMEHVASFGDRKDLPYRVDKANRKLHVTLDREFPPHSQFVLRTVTVAIPTDNILEGIYFDRPIPGKPPTMITQCQQYGFQRIAPGVDRMAAKTFYTTTIVANAEYTNIISNGDLAPGYENKETGAPIFRPEPEDSRPADVNFARKIVQYFNHKTCMSSYLFFLGVGTYVTYSRKLEYPDGNEVVLEMLLFPGLVTKQRAVEAMEALHNSVMWCHTHTGPEQYQHKKTRQEMEKLLQRREELKAMRGPLCTASDEPLPEYTSLGLRDSKELAQIRKQLKQCIGEWKKTGYKYTGKVYREIAMENSDYGGMENVGNTTILSSRMVPSEVMSDGAYFYMEGVKIHEFYHNINGSEVTGVSPFNIWLNEAVTVHVQREREAVLFGADFIRLRQVMYAYTPAVGPLAQDEGPNSMAIEPEGFNRTQELITAMTYSKAPEFVKMVETVIGKENFVKGLDMYHTKFKHSNAVTADWIQAMVDASGDKRPIKMAKQWLTRTGHPVVTYNTRYDAEKKTYKMQFNQDGWQEKKTYKMQFNQDGWQDKPADNNEPWIIPIEWALVKDGKDTHRGVHIMEEESASIIVFNVDSPPDFASVARNWSFFGRCVPLRVKPAEQVKQAMSDPDVVNRYRDR